MGFLPVARFWRLYETSHSFPAEAVSLSSSHPYSLKTIRTTPSCLAGNSPSYQRLLVGLNGEQRKWSICSYSGYYTYPPIRMNFTNSTISDIVIAQTSHHQHPEFPNRLPDISSVEFSPSSSCQLHDLCLPSWLTPNLIALPPSHHPRNAHRERPCRL